jgi:hypothetical protein
MKVQKDIIAKLILESPRGFEKYNFDNCIVRFESESDTVIKMEIETPTHIVIKAQFEKQTEE